MLVALEQEQERPDEEGLGTCREEKANSSREECWDLKFHAEDLEEDQTGGSWTL